jgi:hypothetical protein
MTVVKTYNFYDIFMSVFDINAFIDSTKGTFIDLIQDRKPFIEISWKRVFPTLEFQQNHIVVNRVTLDCLLLHLD